MGKWADFARKSLSLKEKVTLSLWFASPPKGKTSIKRLDLLVVGCYSVWTPTLPKGKTSMSIYNLFLRLFMSKLEKTIYEAAKTDGLQQAGGFSLRPNYMVKVNGAEVNVTDEKIFIVHTNTSGGSMQGEAYTPNSNILYLLLRSLYEKQREEKKRIARLEAYNKAMSLISKNGEKS